VRATSSRWSTRDRVRHHAGDRRGLRHHEGAANPTVEEQFKLALRSPTSPRFWRRQRAVSWLIILDREGGDRGPALAKFSGNVADSGGAGDRDGRIEEACPRHALGGAVHPFRSRMEESYAERCCRDALPVGGHVERPTELFVRFPPADIRRFETSMRSRRPRRELVRLAEEASRCAARSISRCRRLRRRKKLFQIPAFAAASRAWDHVICGGANEPERAPTDPTRTTDDEGAPDRSLADLRPRTSARTSRGSAAQYRDELAKHIGEGFPQLDYVMLGMGRMVNRVAVPREPGARTTCRARSPRTTSDHVTKQGAPGHDDAPMLKLGAADPVLDRGEDKADPLWKVMRAWSDPRRLSGAADPAVDARTRVTSRTSSITRRRDGSQTAHFHRETSAYPRGRRLRPPNVLAAGVTRPGTHEADPPLRAGTVHGDRAAVARPRRSISSCAPRRSTRWFGRVLRLAGPVRDCVAKSHNLPWVIDAARVEEAPAASGGGFFFTLLNDLQATALGSLVVPMTSSRCSRRAGADGAPTPMMGARIRAHRPPALARLVRRDRSRSRHSLDGRDGARGRPPGEARC